MMTDTLKKLGKTAYHPRQTYRYTHKLPAKKYFEPTFDGGVKCLKINII